METPMYGGADLNSISDEREVYYAVNDDDLTIMTGMEWCVQDGMFGMITAENFRGFRP